MNDTTTSITTAAEVVMPTNFMRALWTASAIVVAIAATPKNIPNSTYQRNFPGRAVHKPAEDVRDDEPGRRRDAREKPARLVPLLGTREDDARKTEQLHRLVVGRQALKACRGEKVEDRELDASRRDAYGAVLYELRERSAVVREKASDEISHASPIFPRSTERSPSGAVVFHAPRVKSGMSIEALRFLTDFSLSSHRQHQLARS